MPSREPVQCSAYCPVPGPLPAGLLVAAVLTLVLVVPMGHGLILFRGLFFPAPFSTLVKGIDSGDSHIKRGALTVLFCSDSGVWTLGLG